MVSDPRRPSSRLDGVMLFVSVAAPLAVCAARAQRITDAAHDEAVVRALGLGWTGAFRVLDVVVAHLLSWVPRGTRVLRAALACAALAGVAGGLLYVVGRRTLEACRSAPRVSAVVACLASLCASLSGAWVIESTAAGSSIAGVVLGLLPLVLVSGVERAPRWAAVAGAIGLAASYEPFVGLAAASGALVYAVAAHRSPTKKDLGGVVLGLLAGFLPFALGCFWGAVSEQRLSTAVWVSAAGEGASLGRRSVLEMLPTELGPIVVAASLIGAALGLWGRASRPAAGASVALLLSSALAVAAGAPAGPWRFGGPSLLLVGAGALLAGVALQRVVVAVAEAKVPLAPASAAMVLLLATTFPVLTLDDAVARSQARAKGATTAWNEASIAALPPKTLLLVSDPRLYARILASRAAGELRVDVSVMPTFRVEDEVPEAAREHELAALIRDYLLYGQARERTLTAVAATRPVALGFVPSWDHALSRHLVARGLFELFLPEPRGASERAAAMEQASLGASPLREAVVQSGDVELSTLAVRLLDARSRTLASLGERDGAARASDDALALALPGARGARRARRLETSRFTRVATSR